MLCSALSLSAPGPDLPVASVSVVLVLLLAGLWSTPARSHLLVAGLLEATLAGAAIALSGGPDSALLPYLLAPMLALGLGCGPWAVVVAGAAGSAGVAAGQLAAMAGLPSPPAGGGVELLAATAQWVALGLAVGLVGYWTSHLPTASRSGDHGYAEVRTLLEQLRGVAHQLPAGLDVTSAAQALLDRCAALVPSARSAVLVQPAPDSSLVPAAVRGTDRVPWRAPLTEPGPLRDAWESGAGLVDRRPGDGAGRRAGSALAVIPLRAGAAPIGLLILEAYDEHAFQKAELAMLSSAASDVELRLQAALLFEEVRGAVSLEERDRLAREMHDGVAQELALVGYQLDALRAQAGRLDPTLEAKLVEVRHGLTRLISDIRLSITDLRTTLSPSRGLGTALTSYVRALGSGRRLAVHVTLDESAFRLAGEAEVLLFEIAQIASQDVRTSTHAAHLWVTLSVDPPSARLRIEHDGATRDLEQLGLTEQADRLGRLGGGVTVQSRNGSGLLVEAWLEGGANDSDSADPARRRPRAAAPGLATGVRTD